MRVLLVLAEPFLPQQGGGSQTSALELLSALRHAGADVALASMLKRKSWLGLSAVMRMKVARRHFVMSVFKTHRVYRVAEISRNLHHVVADFEPDVVLVQAMNAMPLAHLINARRVPMVIYWRDVEINRMNGTPIGLIARYLANSEFTASFYAERFGIASVVVPPLIERERYITAHHTKQSVVFVGVVPEKGLDVAIGVALLCPDIPFDFVESWILPRKRRKAVKIRLAAIPNIRFVPYRFSMKSVYGRARLLLAPSQWEEGWGRVASEAHISGIPVVGSRIGGLVEAVGPGGILIDPRAPAAEWATAVRNLWDDQTLHQQMSAAAETYSHRQALDPQWAVQRIIEELEQAIALVGSP